MIPGNTLLQRHTTEYFALLPLVSTHTYSDDPSLWIVAKQYLFHQAPRLKLHCPSHNAASIRGIPIRDRRVGSGSGGTLCLAAPSK